MCCSNQVYFWVGGVLIVNINLTIKIWVVFKTILYLYSNQKKYIKMKQITQTELIEILKGVEKSTFIHLVTTTPVGMNKTDNPYYERVIKKSSCNFLIGNDYEKRVNTNITKEDIETTFKSGELSGKEHISKCVLIDTKTRSKFYLMVERFVEIKPKVEFIFEGNPIEKILFESYLKKVSENKSQPQEKKVIVNTPLIENIKQITINKEVYEII
jgi:hypothetical protein